MKTFLALIMCHLVGDYVLQPDILAKTKGENWYHLFAHCFLYILPFALLHGFHSGLIYIFASHAIIDAAKARYKVIGYTMDQLLHYWVILTVYAFKL